MTERLTIATTPNGNTVRFWTRPDVNDEALVVGILGGDEYRLAELPDDLEGVALDIGAHVGTVGIALAVDHPRLRVVMVEPIPDNVALIRKSIELNGVGDRCTVVEAMAGHGQGTATCRYAYKSLEGFEDQGFVTQNAYVGNIWRLTDDEKVDSEVAEVPIVDAFTLATAYTTPSGWVLVKTDCEGCEWDFLRGVTPKTMPLIIGEWHDGPIEKMQALLKGYVVTVLDDYGGSGIFRAVVKVTKAPPHPVDTTPDPHYRADGRWVCYSCLRFLVLDHGEPIIPWQHKDMPSPKDEWAVKVPGLATTE